MRICLEKKATAKALEAIQFVSKGELSMAFYAVATEDSNKQKVCKAMFSIADETVSVRAGLVYPEPDADTLTEMKKVVGEDQKKPGCTIIVNKQDFCAKYHALEVLGDKIMLEVGSELILSCGTAKAAVALLEKAEVLPPSMANMSKDYKAQMAVPGKVFREMVMKGGFGADASAAKEEAKNVTFRVAADGLTVFSTDSFVIAVATDTSTVKCKLAEGVETEIFAIKADILRNMSRALVNEGLKIMVDEHMMLILAGAVIITVALSKAWGDSIYATLTKMGSAECSAHAVVDSEKVLSALELIALGGNTGAMAFAKAGNELAFASESCRMAIPATIEGEVPNTMVKITFVKEAIKVLRKDKVRIGLIPARDTFFVRFTQEGEAAGGIASYITIAPVKGDSAINAEEPEVKVPVKSAKPVKEQETEE